MPDQEVGNSLVLQILSHQVLETSLLEAGMSEDLLIAYAMEVCLGLGMSGSCVI